MRVLRKFLWIVCVGLPLMGSAQEARFLPGNNLDILQTAHLLGYVFKWYHAGDFDPEAFQNPIVVAASGIPQGKTARSDKDITQWNFKSALISNDQQTVYTLETRADRGLFNPVVLEKKPWGGVAYISLAGETKLPLDAAIGCLSLAHAPTEFTQVDLYKPLHPNATEPVYAFHLMSQETVYVAVVTGKVFTDKEVLLKSCSGASPTLATP